MADVAQTCFYGWHALLKFRLELARNNYLIACTIEKEFELYDDKHTTLLVPIKTQHNVNFPAHKGCEKITI